MKIVITGIAGLLGSNLATYLLENTNHEVVGIDNLSCGLLSNVPTDMKCYWSTIGCNVCDEIFEAEQPDIVYHFAAYAAECLSPFIRSYNYTNNLVATAEIVTACIKYNVQRLVFTSSIGVYGRNLSPYVEHNIPNPIDPYGVAKFACELDIRIAQEQHGLEYCILRPHNVYGPHQVITQKYRNVFGIWLDRLQHGLPLQIYGDGKQRRAFSFIGDMMHPLHMAGVSPTAKNQTINLGGSTPISIEEAARFFIAQRGGDLMYCAPRHEIKDAWCTVNKSQRLLGYADKTSLADGLAAMWRWAETADHTCAEPPTVELSVGLPVYWQPTVLTNKY